MERESKARMIIAIEELRKAAIKLDTQAVKTMRNDITLTVEEQRLLDAFADYAQRCAQAMDDQLSELGTDMEVWV